MWAGIQKSGMVFLNTKFHCTCQLSDASVRPTGMGRSSARSEPPWARMWVSEILWNVMNTGPNVVFMAVLTSSAPSSFIGLSAPRMAAGTSSSPSVCAKRGTPEAKTFMAAAIHMPRNPHTTARGSSPKPGSL